MKVFLTIALVCICLFTRAQTANITLIDGGYYQIDTLGKKIFIEDNNSSFKISLIDFFSKYAVSKYKGEQIFIRFDQIKMDASYNAFLNKIQKLTLDIGKPTKMLEDEKLFGRLLGDMLYFKQPAIGMSKAMIEECLGKPDSSSSTESKYSDSDLWMYKIADGIYKYIYFNNGIVSSIQRISL